MSTFGQILRDAREARGLSPSQVAAKTHILVQIIEGMATEDFHRIPAAIYGRGFVKSYAACVGLDPQPLLREFMDIYEGRRAPTVQIRPVPTAEPPAPPPTPTPPPPPPPPPPHPPPPSPPPSGIRPRRNPSRPIPNPRRFPNPRPPSPNPRRFPSPRPPSPSPRPSGIRPCRSPKPNRRSRSLRPSPSRLRSRTLRPLCGGWICSRTP